MKNHLFYILLIFTITSCKKDEGNAKIVSFNSSKCGCCWGWVIQIDGNEIKSDNTIIGELVGYEINTPIEVTIELGEKEMSCSPYDYYEVKKIEKR